MRLSVRRFVAVLQGLGSVTSENERSGCAYFLCVLQAF